MARSPNLGQSEGLSEWGNEGGAGSETLTRPTHNCKDGNSPHHSSPHSPITVSFPEKPLTFTSLPSTVKLQMS